MPQFNYTLRSTDKGKMTATFQRHANGIGGTIERLAEWAGVRSKDLDLDEFSLGRLREMLADTYRNPSHENSEHNRKQASNAYRELGLPVPHGHELLARHRE